MTTVRSLAALLVLVALTGCGSSSKLAVSALPTTSSTTLATAKNAPATGIGSES